MPIKIVNHSKRVHEIASLLGWQVGARYTNLRDVRTAESLTFLDINWKNYDFEKHLIACKSTTPKITVAKDIENMSELQDVLEQARELLRYAERVVIVPKAIELDGEVNKLIPINYMLGYSVPTRYGGTKLSVDNFERPTHLLGGRPDVQFKLSSCINVYSLDCNRFTLDASFGDYFDGDIFRPHPIGGYERCIRDSIVNINKLWSEDE